MKCFLIGLAETLPQLTLSKTQRDDAHTIPNERLLN